MTSAAAGVDIAVQFFPKLLMYSNNKAKGKKAEICKFLMDKPNKGLSRLTIKRCEDKLKEC